MRKINAMRLAIEDGTEGLVKALRVNGCDNQADQIEAMKIKSKAQLINAVDILWPDDDLSREDLAGIKSIKQDYFHGKEYMKEFRKILDQAINAITESMDKNATEDGVTIAQEALAFLDQLKKKHGDYAVFCVSQDGTSYSRAGYTGCVYSKMDYKRELKESSPDLYCLDKVNESFFIG